VAAKIKKMNVDFVIEYLRKNGAEVTVDENPSPEKIKRIEESIKRKEKFEKESIESYKMKNK